MRSLVFTARCFPISHSRKLYSGLLSGLNDINEVKNASFYALSMDITSTAQFLKKPSYVYQQAEKDLKTCGFPSVNDYIKFVDLKATEWINQNVFYDRELILKNIEQIISKKGNFVCLLGGKSTGKSLLWEHVMNSKNNLLQENVTVLNKNSISSDHVNYSNLTTKNIYKHLSVIHLDMRLFGDADILKALLTFLENTRTHRFREAIRKNAPNLLILMLQNILPVFGLSQGLLPMLSTEPVLELLRSRAINHADVLKEILTELSTLFGPITVVIDEANRSLTPNPSDSARQMKALEALDALTSLSKQSKQINVILCSSDHAFPFRLGNIGFNTSNFTEFMFMGEVPPSSMYKLLTEEWKYGKNLAVVMMEHFGGHVWDHSNGISKLAVLKEDFHPSFVYDIDFTSGVLQCLKRFKKDEVLDYLKAFPADRENYKDDREQFLKKMETNEKRMMEYLASIAVSGFAPVPVEPYEDRVCEVISHNNLGGVVKKTGIVFGLADTVWKGKYFL